MLLLVTALLSPAALAAPAGYKVAEADHNGCEISLGPAASDGAWWLARASALIGEIAPANLDRMIPLAALAEVLAGRAKDPGAARDLASAGVEEDLEGGGASYRVEISQSAGKTVLTISYSVRL